MIQRKSALAIAGLCASFALHMPASAHEPKPDGNQEKRVQHGKASWYGPGFHGRRTASGERFDSNAMTAAHRTLPFGSRVKVVNKRTGEAVVVRINDRGPYVDGRVIDLSRASAEALGITGVGVVELSVL